jgi:carboxylesterase
MPSTQRGEGTLGRSRVYARAMGTPGDGDDGALVLHGLTGTPHEVRAFAEALADRGFVVRVPALAGHADLGTLERTGWREWYAGAEAALAELRAGGRRVLVVGFSAGGLIALRLAALRACDLDALVVLGVPLSFPPWQRRAIAVLARLRRVRPLARVVGMMPKSGPDVRIARELRDSPSLRGMPWPALAELVALQEEVTGLLPHVRTPLLVLHGALDHIARVEDSARIVQAVSSPRVQRLVLPDSFHQLGLDVDREAAVTAVVEFAQAELARLTPPAESP